MQPTSYIFKARNKRRENLEELKSPLFSGNISTKTSLDFRYFNCSCTKKSPFNKG